MTALPALVPTAALDRYDSACRAIAEALNAATAVDAVMEACDAADLLRLHARQAGNRQLEIDAAELRIRGERRVGAMIAAQRDAAGLARGAAAETGTPAMPTLAEAGIDKHLADRARKSAALSPDRFERLLAQRRADVEAGRKRVAVDLFRSTADKAAMRAAREIELAARQRALPDRCYGVILADPEWRFEVWSEAGMDRAAANHYPTSDIDAICARDVRRLAADHCVLFLWATAPMLPEALDAMRAWGFAYKSQAVWMKDRAGTGYWFRNAHELLLVGTRGSPPAPAPGTQWPSVFLAPVGVHSAKPERSFALIEHYYPSLPKIELNRRGPPRPGWDAWGDEAELPAEPMVAA